MCKIHFSTKNLLLLVSYTEQPLVLSEKMKQFLTLTLISCFPLLQVILETKDIQDFYKVKQ